MRTRNTLFATGIVALAFAAPAFAQQADKAAEPGSAPAKAEASSTKVKTTFDPIKDTSEFEGKRIQIGGAFTQEFQALDHRNTATPGATTTLGAIRPGFNLPMANLNLQVQLAKGINVVVENYMSSRHHNEFWVKGGYAQLDVSPINVPVLNKIMEHTTMRVGMFAPNYGDALYRRSDGGFTTANPFAENLILDAFTTEPGADVMVRLGSAFVGGGVTSGQNSGDIKELATVNEKPAFVGKVGVDKQLSELVRVRLSGSAYKASETPRTTLFGGDRTGSNYFGVLETQAQLADTKSPFTNGRLSPAFTNRLTALQVNPFVKVGGLELFGVLERAAGGPKAQAADNVVKQYAGDVVYRFYGDRLYVAGRYNKMSGDLSATVKDISSDRKVLSAGWFLTPGMLTKVEYVTQQYDGFAKTDILNGGQFNGFVIQAALTF